MDERWLDTSDVARRLRRSPRTARRLAASERLAARRFGPAWWVREKDLEAYIAATGADRGPEDTATRARPGLGVCG
jgi:Helix-turn-helix domain